MSGFAGLSTHRQFERAYQAAGEVISVIDGMNTLVNRWGCDRCG